MGFSPNIVNLNYQKNSGVIPSQEVILDFTDIDLPFNYGVLDMFTFNTPNWVNLVVVNVEYNQVDSYKVDRLIFRLVVNQTSANNLPVGLIQENYYVYSKIGNSSGSAGNATFDSLVSLRVTEIQQLSITPQSYTINYTIGDVAPDPEFLQITTGSNWSIASDKSWLTFSQNNGSGSQTINLNINPTGLNVGIHTAEFIVDDGFSTKTGTVTLNITGDVGGQDYIQVNPSEILFSESLNQAPTSTQEIIVDASEALSISTNVSWLNISETNLASGVSSFVVSTQNTESFIVGALTANISLSSANLSFEIQVLLNIFEDFIIGIENFKFYFAQARNRLQLTNGTTNSEVLIDFESQGTLGLKKYSRKIPYYQNSLTVMIGLETQQLLLPHPLPDLYTHFFKPITPVNTSFKVFNKTIGSLSKTLIEEYDGTRWINGDLPTESLEEGFPLSDIVKTEAAEDVFYRLTWLPKIQYLSKDALVSFSFYSTQSVTECTVNVEGTIVTIPVNVSSTNIYTGFINLADFDLNVGDKVEIECSYISTTVFIRSSPLRTHQIIWLNEWDCPEVFNCYGKLSISHQGEEEQAEFIRDGKSYTEIIDVKSIKNFSLDTGQVYSDEEKRFLSSITNSKKVFLHLNSEKVEVLKSFNSVKFFETRKYDDSFSLNFKTAIK